MTSAAPEPTTPQGLDDVVERAQRVFSYWRNLPREDRAHLLEAVAGGIHQHREELVEIADSETALGTNRLPGEVIRTVSQLRFFAEVIREGSYLEVTIDEADPTSVPPRPDLRRVLVPVGPVVVFAASNFPFAFSTLGGDTASALAAGAPVILKAHPGHPATTEATHRVFRAVADRLGMPSDLLQVVHGVRAGADLVHHPGVRAVGFTGSTEGGAHLARLAALRDDPIPFYGELGSVNPVVVTADSAWTRAQDIGAAWAASVTLCAGQLCTKPGIAFIPEGADGDRVVAAAARVVEDLAPARLLTPAITEHFAAHVEAARSQPGVTALTGTGATVEGRTGGILLEVSASDFGPGLMGECFGPAAIAVRYETTDELLGCIAALPPSLAASLYAEQAEDAAEDTGKLREALTSRVGRLVHNAMPTGVAVTWAMHHGGPWPATNSLHTSVGATAIRRFLRPVVFQDAPRSTLPRELDQDRTSVPFRLNGRLVLPAGYVQPSSQPMGKSST
jgi:NADP-dependent aldehyde dehydrogenase